MRYNPPPNWPIPPAGWRPESGWKPDPAWPEPPVGWPLWVEERPVGPGRPNSRAIAIVAAGAVVVIGIGLGLWFGLGGSGPPSDEEQIIALFAEQDRAFNSDDGAAYNATFCAVKTMDKTDEQLRGYKENRGPADSEVVSVEMHGADSATATVWEHNFDFETPGEYPMVRENGKWLSCIYPD